ncbi:MAG: hypothetical protein ACREFI_15595 [Stellaceae bacterium]
MRVRIVLLAAVTLGLSGCLVSEGPLIAPGEAAFPLPDRASAERFTPSGDNGWSHEAYDTAYRSGSAYIVKRENSDEEMPLTLKRIAQNTFIAQTGGGDGGYMYGLLVSEGNTLYEYDVDCADFDAAEMQRYGLIKKDDDCTVTSAQGLAAAYLAELQKGRKPSTAYVLR